MSDFRRWTPSPDDAAVEWVDDVPPEFGAAMPNGSCNAKSYTGGPCGFPRHRDGSCMAGHPPQPPRTNTVVHQFGIYEDPTGGGPLKTQSSVQFRTPGPPVQAMTMKDLREFVESTTEVPDTADLDPLTVDTGSQLDPIAILVGLRVQWEGES